MGQEGRPWPSTLSSGDWAVGWQSVWSWKAMKRQMAIRGHHLRADAQRDARLRDAVLDEVGLAVVVADPDVQPRAFAVPECVEVLRVARIGAPSSLEQRQSRGNQAAIRRQSGGNQETIRRQS